ncbi:MAG: dockerin type I repeat-containing protein, partial [Phycisphaerales bacterium]|nr:dockerin type I repeat-containing protein [Phycisphaerales bacterium]
EGGEGYDVNGDGVINDKDVVIVLRAISGAQITMSDGELAAADVNDDGLVNTQDAIAIMRNK